MQIARYTPSTLPALLIRLKFSRQTPIQQEVFRTRFTIIQYMDSPAAQNETPESVADSGANLPQNTAARIAELLNTMDALKQANEAMAGDHDYLEAMMDCIPDLIYFKDTQSRFLKVSRALARHFGVENPNLVILRRRKRPANSSAMNSESCKRVNP